MAGHNRLLPPQAQLSNAAGTLHLRLPSLPAKFLPCKNTEKWPSGGSRRSLKASLSKPQSRHLTPLKERLGSKPLDRQLSFVPLNFEHSNENLASRYERKPPLCRKPSRARQRVRVEFEDHLNVLTVGVCPAERKALVAAGVRRGHVKGALTSLGVQTYFYDYDGSVVTEP